MIWHFDFQRSIKLIFLCLKFKPLGEETGAKKQQQQLLFCLHLIIYTIEYSGNVFCVSGVFLTTFSLDSFI